MRPKTPCRLSSPHLGYPDGLSSHSWAVRSRKHFHLLLGTIGGMEDVGVCKPAGSLMQRLLCIHLSVCQMWTSVPSRKAWCSRRPSSHVKSPASRPVPGDVTQGPAWHLNLASPICFKSICWASTLCKGCTGNLDRHNPLLQETSSLGGSDGR